jgi:magnesium-transporting ATPase (P-type)
MDWARWERFAPLTGIVAVVLWIVGVLVQESAGLTDKDSPEEILAVLQSDANTIITAGVIFAFGVVFFIWFLGSLRSTLYAAEGGVGRLSSIAYGSGMLAALTLILQIAPSVQGAFDEDELSPEAAQALQSVGEAAFGATEFTLLAMFVAVGLVIMRTRVFGAWLGWLSFLIALVLAIVPIGWAGVVWGFPLWTLITSIVLFRQGSAGAAATPTPQAP